MPIFGNPALGDYHYVIATTKCGTYMYSNIGRALRFRDLFEFFRKFFTFLCIGIRGYGQKSIVSIFKNVFKHDEKRSVVHKKHNF